MRKSKTPPRRRADKSGRAARLPHAGRVGAGRGVVLLGVVSGMALGLAEAHVAALCIEKNTAAALPLHLSAEEWRMAGIFALAGLGAADVPAFTAYRKQTWHSS